MSNITSREHDVIAVAKLKLFELASHEAKQLCINYEIVPEFLGTILLLEARIRNPELAAQFSGPREYAEYVIKCDREAASWIRLPDQEAD